MSSTRFSDVLFRVGYSGVTVVFGVGAVSRIRRFVSGKKRVAVVTGRSSARVSGALTDVEGVLGGCDVEYDVYSGIVTPNPLASQADELAERIWRGGYDAIIAIGGGSVIDAAKVAAVVVASGGSAVDYVTGKRRPRSSLPLCAINLTHGTGTEADRYAVLTVDDTREKRGAVVTYPNLSIDDPRYTLSLPFNQSIYTTLDAFYHAVEASSSTYSSPYTLMHSVEAIEVMASVAPGLKERLGDLEARSRLLYSSLLAGIAIDMSGTHIVHAIEHALSGLNPRLPHGCGLAAIGPRAIYYTYKAVPSRLCRVLKAIDPGLKPIPGHAERAMEAVASFQSRIGFSERLSDYGFGADDLREVVRLVFGGLRYLFEGTPFSVSEDVVKDIYMSGL